MDENLHKKLSALRTEIAAEKNIHPFLVFHAEAVKQMAIQKPNTLAALMEIKFVTHSSASKYGKVFLKLIKNN